MSVADEGPGLPPGEEERVFDKFHRAAPEGAQSGVGLGLSICKAIVQAHGGTHRGGEPARRRRGVPLHAAAHGLAAGGGRRAAARHAA